MASHNDGAQSEEEIEELEDLIRQSEAAIDSVTELIEELAGVDWEYLDVSSGQEQLTQCNTDPLYLQQQNLPEHRESGILEVTEPAENAELEVESELESEFQDLLSSLILELNHVTVDVTENIPAPENYLYQEPDKMEELFDEDKIRRSREYSACDAATQTDMKKKSPSYTRRVRGLFAVHVR